MKNETIEEIPRSAKCLIWVPIMTIFWALGISSFIYISRLNNSYLKGFGGMLMILIGYSFIVGLYFLEKEKENNTCQRSKEEP